MEAYFQPLTLTPTLSPSPSLPLLPEEIFLRRYEHGTLHYGDSEVSGRVSFTLTSHRLIVNDSKFLHLSLVTGSRLQSGLLRRSKVALALVALPNGVIESDASDKAGGGPATYEKLLAQHQSQSPSPAAVSINENRCVKLAFGSDSDCTAFATNIDRALQSQAWLRDIPRSATSNPTRSFSTSGAGISGVMRHVQHDSHRVDAQLEAAFSDLNALMKHAKEIVDLAEKFGAARQSAQSSASASDDKELDAMLESMGVGHIANPVERHASQSQRSYHLQLARELTNLLQPLISDASSMLTLTDVYCLYNRARGVSLISPEECLRAAELLTAIPQHGDDRLTFYEFPSGVRVVGRESALRSTSINDRLTQLITQSSQGLSVLEASAMLRLSSLLIEQQCAELEHAGVMCRDESLEGCKFFPNQFALFPLRFVVAEQSAAL